MLLYAINNNERKNMVTVSPYYKQKNILNPFYTVEKSVDDKVVDIQVLQNLYIKMLKQVQVS